MAPHPRFRGDPAGREDAGDGRVRDRRDDPGAGQVAGHPDHLPHRRRQGPHRRRPRVRGGRGGLSGQAGGARDRPLQGGGVRGAGQEAPSSCGARPTCSGGASRRRASWPRHGPSWWRTWSTRIGSWRASATRCRTTCVPRCGGSKASAARWWRAQGERLEPEGRHYLERVGEASRQMGQLIDDVLYLARVSRAELRQHQVDLSAVAGAVIERLRETEPAREVDVRIRPGNDRGAATDSCSGSCWRTSWATPGSSRPVSPAHGSSSARPRWPASPPTSCATTAPGST